MKEHLKFDFQLLAGASAVVKMKLAVINEFFCKLISMAVIAVYIENHYCHGNISASSASFWNTILESMWREIRATKLSDLQNALSREDYMMLASIPPFNSVADLDFVCSKVRPRIPVFLLSYGLPSAVGYPTDFTLSSEQGAVQRKWWQASISMSRSGTGLIFIAAEIFRKGQGRVGTGIIASNGATGMMTSKHMVEVVPGKCGRFSGSIIETSRNSSCNFPLQHFWKPAQGYLLTRFLLRRVQREVKGAPLELSLSVTHGEMWLDV
ncbi:hypothetical protein EDD18DRAFT_1339719 [Armillaria luteobubalina]|uniref:Uncharacterized protein n=1 Tax=Armillaria luteobubalina TaxID=153913 RepID=A0AA39NXS1_9AGAR|nr:hypothetical protein EDD18DRAFT_1339719 [Armillaria luteobubalina]